MLYMVIEEFRDSRAVYERLQAMGRMAPEGLEYVGSWIDEGIERCFQLMRTDDARLLEVWAANWRDIMDFEFVPVISSAEAAARALAQS